MKQKALIWIGAIILGASTLTIGYAASNSGKEGTSCENMMREHMGMMANEMPRECQEMMRRHGMPATESPGAGPTAPAS